MTLFGTSTRARRKRVSFAIAALLTLVVAMLWTATAPAAEAASNPTNSYVRTSQTWYVYAEAGETVNATFVVAARTSGTFEPTIVVTSPDGVVQDTCSFTVADPNGTTCDYSAVAPGTGVWSVSILGSDGTVTPGELGRVLATWDIATSEGGAEVAGRVWSEDFSMRNASIGRPIPTSDLSLWYLTEQGYIYGIDRIGFNGIDSQFTANAFGNVDLATCATAHSSSFNGSPTIGPVGGACAYTPYKIFFSAPAADLPASVTLPDGSETWLLQTPTTPSIDTFSFTPDAPGSRSGSVDAAYSNYEGTATVLIDTDGDGVFTGPADRSVRVAFVGGTGSFDFDGLDAQGEPIPVTTPIAFRLETGSYGEVHFLDYDVEDLAGGIRVTRLNGPDDGSRTRVFWDDTYLTTDDPTSGKCVETSPISGLAGVDSSAGVHGWDAETCTNGLTGGTWGDIRYIDNWAYIDSDLAEEIVVPAAEPNVSVVKSSDPESGQIVVPGQEVTYSLTYENTGDAPGAVDSTDDLADVLDDAALVSGPTSDTAGITAALDGDVLTVAGALAPGATAVISYTVAVNDPVSGDGELTNIVVGPPGSGCEEGSTSPSCTSVLDIRALEILKTSDAAGDVQAGDTVTYTVTVENTGAVAYTADAPATFSDDLSAVLDDSAYGEDASADIGSVTYTEPGLAWSGPLEPGQTATITYSVIVNDPLSGDGLLQNAVVGPPESNCDAGAAADACTTDDPVRAYEVSKSVDASGEVAAGDTVTYTITVVNTGAFDYTADDPASFVDDLAQVLDDAAYNDDAAATAGAISVEDGTLDWSGPLPTGATVTLTYSVTVRDAGSGDGDLVNVVTADAGSGGRCLDGIDANCATDTPVKPGTSGGGLAVTGGDAVWMATAGATGLLLLLVGGAILNLRRRAGREL